MMYKVDVTPTPLSTECIICGEDIIVGPYKDGKAKVCDKCRNAVLKMRKQEEGGEE